LKSSTSQQANKNLVARYYNEMWNKWNFALVDELLAKDISFRGSLGTETRGRAAFCDYMWRVQDVFPDFHNAIEEMIAERNRVCARLTYTGRHCQSSHRRYTSWGK
jgi:predicted ester cyclase